MADNALTPAEKSRFEELFRMSDGYVLNYSEASFGVLVGAASTFAVFLFETYEAQGRINR